MVPTTARVLRWISKAFSSELDTGSREENASNRKLDIQPQRARGIAARDLRQHGFIHAVDARDMSDRIIFAHIEGIVGAHDDAIGSEHVDQISELVITEDDGVEINLP